MTYPIYDKLDKLFHEVSKEMDDNMDNEGAVFDLTRIMEDLKSDIEEQVEYMEEEYEDTIHSLNQKLEFADIEIEALEQEIEDLNERLSE